MKLDGILRDGWVVEVWYDAEGPSGERFVALVTRGKGVQAARGCGRTAESAIKEAVFSQELSYET